MSRKSGKSTGSRRYSISRRGLLQGLGAGALALPFLRHTRSAHAADGEGIPKRLVIFFTPNEPISKDYWKPAGSGSEFTLPATLPGILQPLQGWQRKLLVLADLRMKTKDLQTTRGGHRGIGHMLTGRLNINWPGATREGEFWAAGVTVDQFLGQRWGVEPLTLGVRCGGSSGNTRISYTGREQPVHPIEDPARAFDRIFGDLDQSDEQRQARRLQRKSVLDFAARELPGLQSRLPTADQAKLERHLAGIRALENKLEEDALSCDASGPGLPDGYDYRTNSNVPLTGRRQIDVMTQALACGATRIASLQIGNSGAGDLTPTWSDAGININIPYHTLAHDFNEDPNNSTVIQRRVQLEQFFMRYHFAYLLEQLDGFQMGDGTTLLDNTLVLWTKCIATNHRGWPMLYLLAGGAGGSLRTNRYVSFPDEAHNRLLVSMCHLLGETDVERFGDPSIGTAGPLSL